jgi:hypothetical protein
MRLAEKLDWKGLSHNRHEPVSWRIEEEEGFFLSQYLSKKSK